MPAAGGHAHSLVEGALLAGLAVVLVFASLFLPVVGPLLILAWPLPVAAAYVRHDAQSAVMVALVTAILVALFQGPLIGVSVGVQMGALGVALGWGLAGRRDAVVTIAAGSVAAAAVLVVSFGISLLFFKQNLLTSTVTEMATAGKQLGTLIGSSASASTLTQALKAVETLVPQVWPTLLVLSALGMSFLGYVVAKRVFARLGIVVPPVPAFAQWRLPWPAVAGWAAGAAILQFHTQHDAFYLTGLNLSILFSEVFELAGVALLYAVLRHFNAPRGLAAIICIVAAINGLFAELLLWAGLFDAMFDYRRFLRARAAP